MTLPNFAAPLAGKAVLVTGAGRGIGRAHALALANAGARVVVNDIGAPVGGEGGIDRQVADVVVAEIVSRGGEAIANHHDISTWEGAAGAVEAAVAAFGRLDGLLNNAGNMRFAPLTEIAQEDVDTLFGVHLRGTLGCMVHALRHWQACWEAGDRAGGAIVNTVSETMLVSLPRYAAYGAMKAGIAHLTTTGSLEARAFGVRVNAYAPRAFTRMSSKAPAGVDNVPSARDAANTSPLVAWLLSDFARHVSGQVFQMAGGGIGVCTPWGTGPISQPDNGTFAFTVEEIDALIADRLLATRFAPRAMAPMPGE
jgi:NAD(P)-dependent dehydrogenase (short-subunit alcohol dehydrogenase family)